MNHPRIISFICVILMGAGLVVFGGCLWKLWEHRQEHNKLLQTEALTQLDLARKKEKLRESERVLERLRTDPAYVELIIRRRLGYAKPGELIYRFESTDRVPDPFLTPAESRPLR